MTNLFHLSSSLNGRNGLSSQLGQGFVDQWLAAEPNATVVQRDLASAPVPHLEHSTWQQFFVPTADRSPEAQAALALSDQLISEVRAADLLVLSVPMTNFGVPSGCKAWVDHIARAGETFNYTSTGPEGLLTGKRAVLVLTRGGAYAGTDHDHQLPWLTQVLGFLGITDVQVVLAEGQGRSDGAKASADLARAELVGLVAELLGEERIQGLAAG